MKTFILGWNPSDAEMSDNGFLNVMKNMEWGDISYELLNKPPVNSGDNFYILRTGTNDDGIVAKGFFLSAPYNVFQGTHLCKVDLRPTFMVSHAHPKGIVTCERLLKAIPGLPPTEDGLCTELSPEEASSLNAIWSYYESTFDEDDFWDGLACRTGRPEAGIDEAVALASDAYFDFKDLDGEPVILHSLAVGLAGKTKEEIICGILNDVLEETDWTAGRIRNKGFSEHIIDTLTLLTHERDASWENYIQRILDSGNQTAVSVKLNALKQNLHWNSDKRYPQFYQMDEKMLDYMTSYIQFSRT